MVSAKFSQDFKDTCGFFGIFHEDEIQSFKVLCRGNMDAAETFLNLIAERIRRDDRFGINERIKASIEAERGEGLKPQFRTPYNKHFDK